jgi:hypothetical protein
MQTIITLTEVRTLTNGSRLARYELRGQRCASFVPRQGDALAWLLSSLSLTQEPAMQDELAEVRSIIHAAGWDRWRKAIDAVHTIKGDAQRTAQLMVEQALRTEWIATLDRAEALLQQHLDEELTEWAADMTDAMRAEVVEVVAERQAAFAARRSEIRSTAAHTLIETFRKLEALAQAVRFEESTRICDVLGCR